MLKNPFILLVSGISLAAVIFFFGRTTSLKPLQQAIPAETLQTFDIEIFISDSKKKLSSTGAAFLQNLEASSAAKKDPVQSYRSLAEFWKDSAGVFEPYAFYLAESAKLENSEKSLTFAAQLLLDNLRSEREDERLNWKTTLAISLYERAIALDSLNDDLRIGLGSCYIFGRGRNGNPQETMKGIQELLAVSRRDPENMKAQLMLGVGGFISGQYDKALERLKRVVDKEPENIEAIAFLADTYAASGNREGAIKWYNVTKKLVNNPHYREEVDRRISELNK